MMIIVFWERQLLILYHTGDGERERERESVCVRVGPLVKNIFYLHQVILLSPL
jgi:hypothetical protein